MFCEKCGKELKEGAKFCAECGAPVMTSGERAAVWPAASKEQAAVESTASGKQPAVGSVVSKEQIAGKGKGTGKLNKYVIIGTGAALAVILLVVIVSVSGTLFRNNDEGTVTVFNDNNNDSDNESAVQEETSYKYFFEEIQVGDVVIFGYYEQDGDLSNGKEPISWIVMNDRDNKYLLLSEYILDCQPWDDGTAQASGALSYDADVEYEKSSIRKWLTESFSAEAFGEEELPYLVPISVRGENLGIAEDNQFATDYAVLMNSNYAADFSDGEYYSTYYDNFNNTKYNHYYFASWLISAPTEYAVQQGVPVYSYEECAYEFAAYQIENWDIIFNRPDHPTYPMDYALWDVRQVRRFSPWYTRSLWNYSTKINNAVFGLSEIGEYQAVDPHQKLGVRPMIYITIPTEQLISWEVDESTIQEIKEHLTVYNGTYDADYFDEATLTISSEGIELVGPRALSYGKTGWCYSVDKSELEGNYGFDRFEYYVDENGYDCFYSKKDKIKLVFNSDEDLLSYWVDYKTAEYDSQENNLLRGQPLGWIELAQYKKRSE